MNIYLIKRTGAVEPGEWEGAVVAANSAEQAIRIDLLWGCEDHAAICPEPYNYGGAIKVTLLAVNALCDAPKVFLASLLED